MAEKALIQLAPDAFAGFDFVSTRYDARIDPGVTPEALLKPEFWAHHAVKLRPMDEIRARATDGTWLAYYVVLDCSRTWAKVQELARHNLTTSDVSLSQSSETEVKAFIEAHQVIHRGPRGWSIVRKSDRAVLAEAIERREEAQKRLTELARDQVGGAAKTEAVSA